MSQCEETENQAEQNKSHAVGGIKAHPTPPHCCLFRNDRRNLAHADLERGITGRERRPPERIDEVDNSERKDNARTKNHENSCGQDAPPILQRFLHLLVTLNILCRLCRVVLFMKYDGLRTRARVHRLHRLLAKRRNFHYSLLLLRSSRCHVRCPHYVGYLRPNYERR